MKGAELPEQPAHKNLDMLGIVKKEFPGLIVEALTIGKYKNDSSLNEDGCVVTENTFAVIDGSAPRTDIQFEGKSSARFATDVVKNVLLTTDPSINGRELVSAITSELNKQIDKIGMRNIVQETKEAFPAALFTAARIVGDTVIITALGDVGCRVNGNVIHTETFASEDAMIEKRISAMKGAQEQNQSLSDEELLQIGKRAIVEDLNYQVKNYFNNPDSDLGLGIINGGYVPDKFIKKYTFKLKDIKTLELFSDGYFVLPAAPEIATWEEAFFAGEKEDPLRWNKYPAVKSATKDMFSDDRTIVIVKRITSLV